MGHTSQGQAVPQATEKTSHEKGAQGAPWEGPRGPLGPQGAPWAPQGALGAPVGPLGPKSIAIGANSFKTVVKINFFAFLGLK